MPKPSGDGGASGQEPPQTFSLDKAEPFQASLLPILDQAPPATAGAGSGASPADQQRMAFVLALRGRGVGDVALLRALETIPREIFVPHHFADLAWRDMALPIACGQTMPQPYIVARMMAALDLEPHHRVLEVGAGSGYATSILSRLAGQVVSCERFRSLARSAQSRLESLNITNAEVRWADGLDLPADAGVFDRIIIDGAVEALPRALLASLAPGGLALFARKASADGQPEGLYALRRTPSGVSEDFLFSGRFTPIAAGRSAQL